MSASLEPALEANRLHELRSTGLLAERSDPSFGSFTELAAHICATPMSFISLVDESRVRFKSAFGVTLMDIERDVSFCAHVIATGQPLQVEDARVNSPFANAPLVVDEPKLHRQSFKG